MTVIKFMTTALVNAIEDDCLEMDYIEAVLHMHFITGFTLTTCRFWARSIALRHPNTYLGGTVIPGPMPRYPQQSLFQ